MFEVSPDVFQTHDDNGFHAKTRMKCGQDSSSSYLRYDDVKILILVIHIILLLFGILGNTAVIFYNIFLNHNNTSSSRLITHLAFADLLVCLTLYSAQITKFFAKDKDERKILCPLRVTALHFSLFLSVMILLSITVEKYLYIAKPLKYPLIVTRRRTSRLLICIWLAAIVQLPLTIIHGIKKGKHEKNPCHPRGGVILFNIIVQLVAIFIITILNFKMFKIVKEQRLRIASEAITFTILQPIRQKIKQIKFEEVDMEQTQSKQVKMEQIQSEQAEMEQIQSEQAEMEQIQSEQAEMDQMQSNKVDTDEQDQSEQKQSGQVPLHLLVEMKAVKTFAIIVAVLICCLVPYNIINIIKYILGHGQHWTHKARRIAYELVGINSIVNAYVYALRHKKYIRAFKQLFSAAWARIMSSMESQN